MLKTASFSPGIHFTISLDNNDLLKSRSERTGWLQDALSANQVWMRIDQRDKEGKDQRWFGFKSK